MNLWCRVPLKWEDGDGVFFFWLRNSHIPYWIRSEGMKLLVEKNKLQFCLITNAYHSLDLTQKVVDWSNVVC